MTIRKGEAWGEPVVRPHGLQVAATDAELAKWVSHDRLGLYGIRAGDVHKEVGAPQAREDMQRLPFDALSVAIDESPPLVCVAHVVARRHWWHGQLVVVANCSHMGTWNIAPRAHPNDGRFDVIEVAASMTLRSRVQARRRLPLGTHVPHPDLTVTSATEGTWTFESPIDVTIDGVGHGRCTRLAVTILPDHFAIYV